MVFEFIDVLRAIATLLITNSHFEVVYPIKALATGGLLGNSVFFIVSGFCLSSLKDDLFHWFGKRIIRIYPACTIITIISVVFGSGLSGVSGFFRYFIYPTGYGFVEKIIGLYIPYYFICKYGIKKRSNYCQCFCVFVILVACVVVGITNTKNSEWLFYLALMLTGALYKETIQIIGQKKFKVAGMYSILLLIIYYAIEYITKKDKTLDDIRPFNYIILFACVAFGFLFFMSYENFWRKKPVHKGYKLIKFLSNRTLEIYLVQVLLIPRFPAIKFPFSVLILTGEIIIGACILKFASDSLTEKLIGLIEKIRETQIKERST